MSKENIIFCEHCSKKLIVGYGETSRSRIEDHLAGCKQYNKIRELNAENKRLLDILSRAYMADIYECAEIVEKEMAERESK